MSGDDFRIRYVTNARDGEATADAVMRVCAELKTAKELCAEAAELIDSDWSTMKGTHPLVPLLRRASK